MTLEELLDTGSFAARHIGPRPAEVREMLAALGVDSVEALMGQALPASIRQATPLELPAPRSEEQALAELKALAARNRPWRSFIGMGYCGTWTPPVIQRNVLESPGWYTPYTPYQAEISQGRLEALITFQQMLIDLTGLPVANASLLDEATAAAEAMSLIQRSAKSAGKAFFVDAGCHPQVIAVVRTRARWLGIPLVEGDAASALDPAAVFGAHLQYPDTAGRLRDWSVVIARVHAAGGLVSLGVDPLALVLLRSPGALGADVAIGSAQRFGVPLGCGGPHPGFLAARESLLRQMPGRIVGLTKDAAGRPAYRMALQTREQHIRREKATSNICTSQVLLANVAGLYAVWHGPEGLRRIAQRVHFLARLLARAVPPESQEFFDTLNWRCDAAAVRARAEAKSVNLRYLDAGRAGATLDETTTLEDVADLAWILTGRPFDARTEAGALAPDALALPAALVRADAILAHPVFHRYRSETEMMRYLKRLESRDYGLAQGMIPLGSCTMKLNAAAEMAPISWPEFAGLHPFAPREQAAGTHAMLEDVAKALEAITGLPALSLQPNSGANGEYAGLVTIRNYHASRGEGARDVCLIPASAHGTNPASAHMAGLEVAVVACDTHGNVDVADLRAKIARYGARIAALMLTYPSTHGVFEEAVREICDLVHAAGGQIYLDGANLNALAGYARVAEFGADVCHINLHKTFCIPHGGGGPGMGPIAVAAHLARFLPSHPVAHDPGLDPANGAVSAAPWGSALIVAISWMYLRMMGAEGLRRATATAVLSANYVAERLRGAWPVLYTGAQGRNAHECIFDLRALKERYGVTAEDVAKRLMDYGFHAPTLAFPVHETLMFEPTESEPKAELDRFCDAMLAIRGELERLAAGAWPHEDNPLRNAPHTAEELAGEWRHPYSREQAAYPLPAVRAHKYWPPVKRVDQVFGDRHFFCACPPPQAWLEEHEGAPEASGA
ncbi:MAG TPA: aminomethyl-transferring glycine dehydrogenase [Burkholderiales bacterium]|nr:aminomethyl-transferring glycine dehydrogenase [Burkholderiales bacterium]